MKKEAVACVLAWCLLLALVIEAQRSGTAEDQECTDGTACEPWNVVANGGPFCNRGSRIPMKFMLDVASEDFVVPSPVCNINGSHNITYAFCPRVDELQAFNLTLSGRYTATWLNSTTGRRLPSNTNGSYLSLFGFGTSASREEPQRGQSEGSVLVAGACPGDHFKTAIVPFLILNVTMEAGRFKYYANYPQAAGTGFQSTCALTGTGEEVCILDHTMPCFGPAGRKNCAVCYDAATEGHADVMSNVHIQVWTSYYGSDKSGRQMRSGSSNPLNFQAFGGGGMMTSLSKSLDDVGSGEFGGDPADPAVKLKRHIAQLRAKLKQ